MEFLAATSRNDRQKKNELKRQIEALQQQITDLPDDDGDDGDDQPPSPKRHKLDNVLAPATPSPKKKPRPHPRPALHPLALQGGPPKDQFVPFKPTASTVISRLANLKPSGTGDESEKTPRSDAFTDAPKAPDAVASTSALTRDDRLAIVETLQMGPSEHVAPFDDPRFEQLEPNSGIRLSSRTFPHDDFQDYLRGRYYLSPSRLYSCIQLLPDRQGYDVPVDADWITIAVVAERGAYKHAKAPETLTREDDAEGSKWKGKAKEKAKPEPKATGRRYVNLKLVDFGRGGRQKSSASSGKAVIGGDAQMSLLLFESEGFDLIQNEDGSSRKNYRGGSRGAFEELCDVKEGTVIALLNPRILKPFQKSKDPHPIDNILALTPESGTSVLILGRSKDLGQCPAQRRDGRTCGSWYDRRVSEVCEWHVQYAVTQTRAGRAEFSSSTTGLGTSARAPKRKSDAYDPRKKWGLAPAEADSGPTYIVKGHVVGPGSGAREAGKLADNIGREGQAKASRQLAMRDEDKRLLKALGGRDREEEKRKEAASQPKPAQPKPPPMTIPKTKPLAPAKSSYTPEMIQRLGFDPTLKPGQRRSTELGTRDKLDGLARLTAARTVQLGPGPGPRVHTTVRVPSSASTKTSTEKRDVDLDSDDELPEPIMLSRPAPLKKAEASTGEKVDMVDLDDF
ncbi:zf-primase domain-containing protein [Mycena kentingensis (nom. inval.)]|nr:zf-primase domain-containing protein [Mycena kentingensis (nom. inval.)]